MALNSFDSTLIARHNVYRWKAIEMCVLSTSFSEISEEIMVRASHRRTTVQPIFISVVVVDELNCISERMTHGRTVTTPRVNGTIGNCRALGKLRLDPP